MGSGFAISEALVTLSTPVLACVLFFLFPITLILINIFHKLWWTPMRLQKFMARQGIRGPSYQVFHGNTKQMIKINREAMSTAPRSLSHDIFSIVLPHLHSWSNKYGKNLLYWHGTHAHLAIMDPELCKEILNDKDGGFPKGKPEGYIQNKLIGDGLPRATGAKWAKMRKLSYHAFHGESLKGMIPTMIESAEAMLEKWKEYDGKEIEVYEQFRQLTSEVIAKTAFGSSYLEGINIFDKLIKLGSLINKNSSTLGFLRVFKSRDEIESDKIEKGIHDTVAEIVKKREKKALSGGELDQNRFGNDFLGLLLKAHHDADEDQRITVQDLVDECKTFYFAGHDTASTLFAWIVFLLALHTDWQEEARKEVFQVFGKEAIPTPSGITKLRTVSLIINETLRLYPPVVSVDRKVQREVKLGKFIVPANVGLHVQTLAIHHDPELWGQDVNLFKPERFSEGIAKATNNNIAAFMPFGLGPRTCVGMNFVTAEAKIALSMILQRYSFTLSPGYIHSPYSYLTVRARHGVQVVIRSLQ